jgi:uncharacterized DUF497 family protein
MHYQFEWDDRKAQGNLLKHGVSFEEAQTVFSDVFAFESYDRDHSAGEDRFIIMGVSDGGRLLTVAFTARDYRTIRLISARPALRNERLRYEEQIESRRRR